MEKKQAQIQFLQRLQVFLAGEMGAALGDDTGAQDLIDCEILAAKSKEREIVSLMVGVKEKTDEQLRAMKRLAFSENNGLEYFAILEELGKRK